MGNRTCRTPDGGIIIEYHFNAREWDVVEDLRIIPGGIFMDRYDEDQIERSYRWNDGVFTSTDQGKHALLTLTDGTYTDELGNAVYKEEGGISSWHRAVLMHRHYQLVYKTEAFEPILAKREVELAAFNESNSLALEILDWTAKYEGKYPKKEVFRFAVVGGDSFVLTDDQLKNIKNAWLVVNEKPRMATWPHHIPEASFKSSRGKAKKKGVTGAERKHFVLELQVAAEHADAFRAAMAQ